MSSIYDFELEHNGIKEGFILAKGENGPLYSWSLEDALSSQRDFDEYGYASEPNDVNQPIHIGDFSGGAGLEMAPPGEQTTDSYSYSQGCDLSWPGRVYISPLLQTGTSLNDAPFKVIFTSQGTFGITATELWEWTGSAWTTRLASVTPTDIAEFEGNIFIAMGSNSYQYTANGTSFTISNLTSKVFSFFAVRSGQDGSAVLWGIEAAGSLRPNPNPINGGDEWSAAEQIGDTWETITAFLTAQDFIYVFKEEGIYSFDGTLIEDVWPARTLARPANGKGAFLWVDGLVYLHLGGMLYSFDPGSRDLQQIWPLPDRIGHPELNGSITGLGGDDQHIYFALKNAAGNTYIMKGTPSTGAWHSWAYLGANDCDVVSPQRAGDINSSNPSVVVGRGSALRHFILPGANLRPESDASYQFDTGDGVAIFPALDGGAPLYSKFITAARIVTEATVDLTPVGTRIARLSYAIDGSSTFTELVIANGPGVRIGVPPDAMNVGLPWSGTYDSQGSGTWWIYQYVVYPITATMFSLLAFFVASAAFRAFRAKNVEAILLLGTAFVVLLGRSYAGSVATAWVPEQLDVLTFPGLTTVIMGVVNAAGQRAIMIGVALGVVATSLKIILGVDRSYLGSGD